MLPTVRNPQVLLLIQLDETLSHPQTYELVKRSAEDLPLKNLRNLLKRKRDDEHSGHRESAGLGNGSVDEPHEPVQIMRNASSRINEVNESGATEVNENDAAEVNENGTTEVNENGATEVNENGAIDDTRNPRPHSSIATRHQQSLRRFTSWCQKIRDLSEVKLKLGNWIAKPETFFDCDMKVQPRSLYSIYQQVVHYEGGKATAYVRRRFAYYVFYITLQSQKLIGDDGNVVRGGLRSLCKATGKDVNTIERAIRLGRGYTSLASRLEQASRFEGLSWFFVLPEAYEALYAEKASRNLQPHVVDALLKSQLVDLAQTKGSKELAAYVFQHMTGLEETTFAAQQPCEVPVVDNISEGQHTGNGEMEWSEIFDPLEQMSNSFNNNNFTEIGSPGNIFSFVDLPVFDPTEQMLCVGSQGGTAGFDLDPTFRLVQPNPT